MAKATFWRVATQRLQRHARQLSWVVADQALVSAMNFLTAVALVRLLGLRSYGSYVTLYAIVLYFYAVSMSLISSPMFSLVPQCDPAERRRLLGGILWLQCGLACGSGLVVLGAGELCGQWQPTWPLHGNLLPLAVATSGLQLQDWLRRYFFLVEKPAYALQNDAVSSIGQVAAILLLFARHRLTVGSTLLAVGATSLLAFLMGLRQMEAVPLPEALGEATRKLWRASRDLFFASQAQWAGSQGLLLIGAGLLGSGAAGVIRASQTLLGPLGVFFQMFENVIPAHAARCYRNAGTVGLLRFLRTSVLLGTAGLLIVSALIAVFSQKLLILLYGPALAPFYPVVLAQLVYLALSYWWYHALYLHRTLQSTVYIAQANLLACGAALSVGPWLLTTWHEVGLPLTSIVGATVSIVYLFVQGRVVVQRSYRPAAGLIAGGLTADGLPADLRSCASGEGAERSEAQEKDGYVEAAVDAAGWRASADR